MITRYSLLVPFILAGCNGHGGLCLPISGNCSGATPPASTPTTPCWTECDPGAPESGQQQGACPAGSHEGVVCCPTSNPSCTPNTCIPEAQRCVTSAQCCAGTCELTSVDDGTCVCAEESERCVTSDDCCTSGSTCMAGACRASCTQVGEGCSGNTDCCSGNCSLNGCVP